MNSPKLSPSGGNPDEPLYLRQPAIAPPLAPGRGGAAGPDCRFPNFSPPRALLEANSAPAAPTGLAAAAGDQSITLTWTDPGDASITRYEYNVNHNDTSTGNLSGWSPWTAISGSGSTTTSHQFTGLTNGREYRYHLRAVNANGESVGAPNAPPWFVKAVPAGPPAAPTGLTATAGDKSVTLSWNNPGDSTITRYEYNVNHNATGTGNFTGWSPWTAIPNSGKDTTGHTFTGLTNGREYRYHLRAVNDIGPSVGAPANGPPWFASATPTSPDPDPPTNLRVERVCDHHLKVRWHRSAGATGYDLEIGSANGKHWKRLLTNWPGNSWYATNWQKDRTYRFAVRAVNEGGTSEWVNSALSVAPPCAVDNLRVTTSTPGEGDLGAAGGSITASWNAGKRANAYHLELNGTRIESNLAATTHSWTAPSPGSNDTVSVQSVNGGLASPWRNANVAWLTASSVKGTTATLNLAGHSGAWYFKKTAPAPAGDCTAAGNGATHGLSNLTGGTAYTFTSYSDSACANAMASTTFSTIGGVSVSNLGETQAGDGWVGRIGINNYSQAQRFTTGSTAGGYVLQSVTVRMGTILGSPTGFTAAIHEESNGNPAVSATYTLTGPQHPANGQNTYTCPNSCSLGSSAKYFLVLSATGPNSGTHLYNADYTGSTDETNTPSSAGWDIANERKYRKNDSANWLTSNTDVLKVKVAATVNP